MTLVGISAEPFDSATVAILGRITFAATSEHLFHRQGDDVRTCPDTTFDVTKIGPTPGEPEDIRWLACRRKLLACYAQLKYPSTLPGEPAHDAARPKKIHVLREFLADAMGRALVTPLLRATCRLTPHIWLDVLSQNDRAIGFCMTFGFVAIGDGTYIIGARRFISRLMARPLP